ncbi:hypothetical protein [Runella sp.]|uniref:hypothetical protein n=1 Tax=Runella sp. TaxID=1960881 RepID=UPI003D0A6F4E
MQGIIKDLTEWTRQNGGHEKRFYLGLSQLHKNESDLVREMQQGSAPLDDKTVLRLALGYSVEADIRSRLEGIALALPNTQKEIVAWYDKRVKGHIEGLTCMPNQIFEIKSTVSGNLDEIRKKNILPDAHFLQAQSYMHHGRYQSCLFVYVARDTGELWSKELWYIKAVGEKNGSKSEASITPL